MRKRLGPLAAQHAFSHFSLLVRRDEYFIEQKNALINEHPWIIDVNVDLVTAIFEAVELLEEEDLATANALCREGLHADLPTVVDFAEVLSALSAHDLYDQIDDGLRFMLRMLQSEHPLLMFGERTIFLRRPILAIEPEDDLRSFLARSEAFAKWFWSEVEGQRGSQEWAAKLYAQDLERNLA